MQKLPIGIQTFARIREEGYLYVDKTEQIHRLVTSGGYFFLSRPRRFGKSLTLSTIKEMYSGSRDLFKGLWIENRWDWDKIHPVVHIQFNAIGYASNGLEYALNSVIDDEAKTHHIELEKTGQDQRFLELLQKLTAKKGKVVLLIDEYDKPLIDYLEKEDLPIAFAHQKILKNFYSIIKSADPYIELLVITGVSKFSKVSIFSDLNNLDDITLDENVADLVGYTQAELEHFFEPWINYTLEKYTDFSRESLLELIKKWYNGYSWDGQVRVYNPFSILSFFKKRSFEDYWFKTGTPTFLIKKMKEDRYFKLDEMTVNALLFESYSLDNLELRSLLFQTGYLTVKKIDRLRGLYTLGYPNREVEQALNSHLIGSLLHKSPDISATPVVQLETAFVQNEPEQVAVIINDMLKSVPSLLLANQDEHFYHALVHLHFRYLGFFIESEVHTSNGRMDAVVHTPERIFIIEFKINESAAAALQQITKKDYAARFKTSGKQLVGLGINFNTEKRCVDDWATDSL
jgi:Predicted AAA-ATPase/PD-(D/E)XK nuclease superfamily